MRKSIVVATVLLVAIGSAIAVAAARDQPPRRECDQDCQDHRLARMAAACREDPERDGCDRVHRALRERCAQDPEARVCQGDQNAGRDRQERIRAWCAEHPDVERCQRHAPGDGVPRRAR